MDGRFAALPAIAGPGRAAGRDRWPGRGRARRQGARLGAGGPPGPPAGHRAAGRDAGRDRRLERAGLLLAPAADRYEAYSYPLTAMASYAAEHPGAAVILDEHSGYVIEFLNADEGTAVYSARRDGARTPRPIRSSWRSLHRTSGRHWAMPRSARAAPIACGPGRAGRRSGPRRRERRRPPRYGRSLAGDRGRRRRSCDWPCWPASRWATTRTSRRRS